MTLISLQLTVFCSAFLETSMIFFEIAMLSLLSFSSYSKLLIFPQFCFVIWTSYECIGNDFLLKTKDCYWISSLVLEKSIFNSYIITCTQYNWKKHEHILCWPSKSANRIENNSVLICSSGTHIKLHFLFERIQSWIMTLLVRTIWTRVL